MRLAGVAIAVGGEQHLRLDLAEAVEHAARRRSPASTTTRSRRGSSAASIAITVSGMFGRKPATRSPGSTPAARKPSAMRATSRAQLAPGQLAPLAALVAKDDRRRVVVAAQQVLRVVEARADEPARAGHAVAVFEDLRGARLRRGPRRSPTARSRSSPGTRPTSDGARVVGHRRADGARARSA